MTTEPHHDIHEQWHSGMGHPFLQRHEKQSGLLWSACLIGQFLGEANSDMRVII